jgi:hypothetical protein
MVINHVYDVDKTTVRDNFLNCESPALSAVEGRLGAGWVRGHGTGMGVEERI